MKQIFKRILALSLSLAMISLCGCSGGKKDTEIVFTTPFEEDEVFRIDEVGCRLGEVRVYMKQIRDQYEGLFGREIWSKDLGEVTLGEELKDTVLARMAQLKVMELMAKDYGISLDDSEIKEADTLAGEYADMVSDNALEEMGASRELVSSMYREYLLASKVYSHLTGDVNPEISDDEARTICVRHILIKTYVKDISGNMVEYSESDRKKAEKKIRSIQEELAEGGNFDELALKYNEDDKTEYSFMKGEMPQAFEEAAFSLEPDQVSDIVTSPYGYHLIKCINNFDREETDRNKEKIIRKRKNEAFNKIYGEFVKQLHSNLNDELWQQIEF